MHKCRHLIHAPYWTNSDTDLQKAWAGMEAIKANGKARSIGVSNYEPRHLKATLATARIPPSINQIEFHPYFAWREGRNYLLALREDNVAVSAYGALTPLTRNIPGPLDEKIQVLAKKYNVNPELICLRWCIDQDIVVVTTTRHVVTE
jgi:diketogulonate reductase-like aldo/keto reductase